MRRFLPLLALAPDRRPCVRSSGSLRRLGTHLSRRQCRARTGSGAGRFPRSADQRSRAPVGAELGPGSPGSARASVPGPHGGLYSSRSAALAHLGGTRSANAGPDRDSHVQQHLRAESRDLDGRASASSRVRGAHLAGIFDRQVGRQHPHHLHHAYQAGMDAPQRAALERPDHAGGSFHPARQPSDARQRGDGSGVSDRAADQERRLPAQRQHRRQLAVALRVCRGAAEPRQHAACRASCPARIRSCTNSPTSGKFRWTRLWAVAETMYPEYKKKLGGKYEKRGQSGFG